MYYGLFILVIVWLTCINLHCCVGRMIYFIQGHVLNCTWPMTSRRWGSCGRCRCPASQVSIIPTLLVREKVKIQNSKYSFYWLCLIFAPLSSQKSINHTTVHRGLSVCYLQVGTFICVYKHTGTFISLENLHITRSGGWPYFSTTALTKPADVKHRNLSTVGGFLGWGGQ